eukprot:SAG22_NODE_13599_length_401_cov_0.400662_1_plen_41_part_01
MPSPMPGTPDSLPLASLLRLEPLLLFAFVRILNFQRIRQPL